MKFTGRIENFNSELWGHHLVVPNDVAEQFVEGKDRRVICKLGDDFEFSCALMPKGGGGFFINLNKEIRKKLDLREGMEIKGELRKDKSKYGMPMPEEFMAVLESDEVGWEHFHALTPGKQRSLIYIVGKPKSVDIRIRKAIVILEHLHEQNGKIDFKILNQDFKNKKDR